MPILVRRVTLVDQLCGILIAPFAVMLVAIYIEKWKILTLLFSFLLALFFARLQDFMPDRNLVICFCCCILVLMFVAVIGTVWDYFRFGGLIEDEFKYSFDQIEAFIQALVQGDRDRAVRSLSRESNPNIENFKDHFDSCRRKLGNDVNIVSAQELKTVNHQIFRASLKHLFELQIGRDDCVVLVPMIESLTVSAGSPMKLARFSMSQSTYAPHIVGFDICTIQRPKILN